MILAIFPFVPTWKYVHWHSLKYPSPVAQKISNLQASVLHFEENLGPFEGGYDWQVVMSSDGLQQVIFLDCPAT